MARKDIQRQKKSPLRKLRQKDRFIGGQLEQISFLSQQLSEVEQEKKVLKAAKECLEFYLDDAQKKIQLLARKTKRVYLRGLLAGAGIGVLTMAVIWAILR